MPGGPSRRADHRGLLHRGAGLPPAGRASRRTAVVADPGVYERAAPARARSFWAEQAGALDWFRPWDTVLEWDLPFARWFDGGTLNVSLQLPRPPRGRRPGRQGGLPLGGRAGRHPHHHLRRAAGRGVRGSPTSCKGLGVRRGDRVAIYMPMIPELPVAMLACTRIGAAHSVVFGGFSSDALRDRINDAEARVVVTADGGWRRGPGGGPEGQRRRGRGRDARASSTWWWSRRTGDDGRRARRHDRGAGPLVARADDGEDPAAGGAPADTCEPEHMEAEDLLFILYTSGTTAKPKGIMHTTGGYLTQVAYTHRAVFDLHPDATSTGARPTSAG